MKRINTVRNRKKNKPKYTRMFDDVVQHQSRSCALYCISPSSYLHVCVCGGGGDGGHSPWEEAVLQSVHVLMVTIWWCWNNTWRRLCMCVISNQNKKIFSCFHSRKTLCCSFGKASIFLLHLLTIIMASFISGDVTPCNVGIGGSEFEGLNFKPLSFPSDPEKYFDVKLLTGSTS